MKEILARGVVMAALLATGVASARADDPAPAQIDLAKKVLISVGLKASMDQIVPSMLGQLQRTDAADSSGNGQDAA